MTSIFHKLRGNQPIPARPKLRSILSSALVGLIALSIIAGLATASGIPLILGSFGATCVILGFPDAPFAQPRNIIGGHVLSSGIGMACLTAFGSHWWSMALAVALAIAAMHWARVVHPPAGSNPVIVMLAKPDWGFVLFPTATGAVLLVLVALVYHNLPQDRSYPRYW